MVLWQLGFALEPTELRQCLKKEPSDNAIDRQDCSSLSICKSYQLIYCIIGLP
jgi:hypothetical protein